MNTPEHSVDPRALPPEEDKLLVAGITFIRRTAGLRNFQLRYSDDEQPVVWNAIASYPEGGHVVAASLHPVQAVLRLCVQLAEGGTCTHCGRTTALEPGEFEISPTDETCFYVYDSARGVFRRGCEEVAT